MNAPFPWSRLLILTPSRDGVVSDLSNRLVSLGARRIVQVGMSDIAHARCKVAGVALSTNAEWFLWLDDDVCGPVSCLEQNVIHHWSLAAVAGHRIAIAGRYVSRGQPNRYAARATGLDPVRVLPELPLTRVVAGMGAMLYHRHVLDTLADAVPWIDRGAPRYPAAFATGPVLAVDEEWSWGPEDFTHCAYLEHLGIPVVLAPQSCWYWHCGHRPRPETVLFGQGDEPYPIEADALQS